MNSTPALDHVRIAPRPALLERLGRALLHLLTLYPLLLLALSAVHIYAPQRSGPLALTQILAPLLFWLLLPLVPLALARRTLPLKLALIACLVVAVVRFGPTQDAAPVLETPDARRFSALTWNLELTNRNFAGIIERLTTSGADIVALQELTPEQAEALQADPLLQQRYPYQMLNPRPGVSGMGLLSRFPILKQHPNPDASPRWAQLDLGDGRTLTVFNAHPSRSGIQLPFGYDPSRRDEQIATIRARTAPLLARGEPILLLGDFNITEREPAYHELTSGLQDAHALVGSGSGNSWRPELLKDWNIGLLRIDYLLTSPDVTPLRLSTDCTPRGGDHCIVEGVFEMQRPD